MRALRIHSRFWAFLCAWVFLPWMHVAMAAHLTGQVSCCESMQGMMTMAARPACAQMRVATSRSADARRALCLAACQGLSATAPAIQRDAPAAAHVPVVSRIVLILPPAPAAPACRSTGAAPPRLSTPPFLAARLQV